MDNSAGDHNGAGSEAGGKAAAGAAAHAGSESRWEVFLHAIRGTGGDPTAGPLKRAVILLAIPMVLEMVMESLFAVVDIYLVSRLGD